LSVRQPDGATKRDHLESVERQTGKRPAALDGPELPAWGRHIFAAWIDLHAGRGGNGMGPNPIAWADLAAWAALTGTEPSPFEVRTIMAIDRAWLEEQARTVTRTPPPAPPPSRNPGSRTRP
jgi:hypothetical protein